MASEKIYTIPLHSQTLKTRRHKRAKRAVSAVRQFMEQHSKASEIRLGKHLNAKLWEQGMRAPPRRIKVRAESDGKDSVTVELVGAPREVKKEPEKKAVTPAEKIAEKLRELKPGNAESPAKGDSKTGKLKKIKTEMPAKTGDGKTGKSEAAGSKTQAKSLVKASGAVSAGKAGEPVEKKQPEKASSAQ